MANGTQENPAAHGVKVGGLDNPEVYRNVPGHVIPILEQEFDDFDTEADKFLRAETEAPVFMGFRLRQGVYGQRQPNAPNDSGQAALWRGQPRPARGLGRCGRALHPAEKGPYHHPSECAAAPHSAA